MTTLRNICRLLSPRERKQVLLLVPLLGFTAVVEVVGIASVVPFLTLVADPGAMARQPLLTRLYELGGFEGSRSFLIALGVLMFAFIVGSNFLNALSTWAVMRFSWMRNHTIALRILRGYLGKPYPFFLERHSAHLGKNLVAEVQQVVAGTLVPVMQGAAKAIAGLAVLGLLFYVDPALAALVALVLGGAYGLIFAYIRRKQHRMGEERVVANESRFEILSEAFGGIKEIKLRGSEGEVVRRFVQPSYQFAASTAYNAVVAQIPRFALEAAAFGGIVLMVLYLLGSGEPFEAILPTLGLYAFAGYRLMPSLQQIFVSLANIRFNSAALDKLIEDLPSPGVQLGSPAAGPPIRMHRSIRLRDVWFQFATAREPLFRGLDLELCAGSSIAFVGATGSGKSTLADLILGLLRPDRGTIEIDGVPLTDETVHRWQRNLGYVPQAIFLTNDTIARNIAFGVPDEEIDMEAVKRAARAAAIDRFVENDMPNGYWSVVGERGVRISGGQRQRLGIARALYHDPEVLVLDEATSSLDNLTEERVLDSVSRLAGERTILTIAHRLSTVRACDRIHLMASGEIVASGRFEELMASSAAFRDLAKQNQRVATPSR